MTKVAGAQAPARAWVMGGLAWLLPGLGHFLQGRWGRGLLLFVTITTMFLVGFVFHGHLFPVEAQAGDGSGGLLQVPPTIANLGAGALYLACLAAGQGFTEQAQYATYEYGNTFLLVAGLLNYLAMLDAFDIAAGRKP